jgi:RHS repeat-associated protein
MDAAGRPVQELGPDGVTRDYVFGAQGELADVRISTDDGAITSQLIAGGVALNPRGQRSALSLGNGVQLAYDYEPATFRLSRLHASALGAARDYLDIAYTYDAGGSITRWADRVQDPAAATPVIRGLSVSAACDFTYDAYAQLATASGRVHKALLPSDDWAGSASANVIKGTRFVSLNDGSAVERYTRTYTYDLSGNLQRTHHAGVSQQWNTDVWTSAASNRSLPADDLSGTPVANPENWFDAAGNTIQLPHLRSLEWTSANRLSRAVVIDRSSSGQPDDDERYVYDGDGARARRVSQRLVSAGLVEITDTLYFAGCEIRRVSRNGTTRLLRRTSHIVDGRDRIATLHQWDVDTAKLETDDIKVKKTHYLLGNHLGSVVLELDETGGVISYEEYFPYGGTSFIAGAAVRDVSLKEYRYGGRLRDDVTGFYHYDFREYVPWTGHWLSADPAGSEDGTNLYAFVHGNPISLTDPDGLAAGGLQVELNQLDSLPPELQKRLDADPTLRREWERGNAFFVPGPNGEFRVLDRAKADEYVRAENAAKRVPRLALVGGGKDDKPPDPTAKSGGGMSEAQMDALFDSIQDILRPLRDLPLPQAEGGGDHSGSTVDAPTGSGETPVHPADGSSGFGSTAGGKTGETGSNGVSTTGTGPGGSGTSEGAAKTTGPGGQGRGGAQANPAGSPEGAATIPAPAAEGPDERPEGQADVAAPPPGYQLGEGGIPYTPELTLPPPTGTGTPQAGPAPAAARGAGADDRGRPGDDQSGQNRPPGVHGRAAGGSSKAAKAQKAPGHSETALDTALRWAGYLNLVFSKPGEEGDAGGLPGGLGLLGLRGTLIQVAYIAVTIINTIQMVASIVRSVSMATIRGAAGGRGGQATGALYCTRLPAHARHHVEGDFGRDVGDAIGLQRRQQGVGNRMVPLRLGPLDRPLRRQRLLEMGDALLVEEQRRVGVGVEAGQAARRAVEGARVGVALRPDQPRPHVYAQRTRFIPDAITRHFESRTWPPSIAQEAKTVPARKTVDVQAHMRRMWK